MTRRPYIDKTHPEVYRAMNAAVLAGRKAYDDAGLPRDLVELVNVRVSQINGCPTCLSVHVPAARKAGIDELTLDLLPSWRHDSSGQFTSTQRAALGLAEALTAPQPGTGRPSVDTAVAEAAAEFTEQQIGALEWAVILINAYNRISIGSGHPPVPQS